MSLSREARGLVEAARREKSGPSDEQRKRMRRAVLVAVGTGTVAGATATSTAAAAAVVTSSSLSVVGKVGIGLFALVVAGGGAALVVQRSPIGTEASVPAHTAAPTAAFATSAPAEPTSAPAEPTSTAPQLASAVATVSAPEASSQAPTFISASATKPTAEPSIASSALSSANRSSANGSSADGLAEEVALLKAAQTALGSGRPSDALASLDQHVARFPKGALALEQRALRAMALCASGRSDEGRRISDALSTSAPGSPLAERVAAACNRLPDDPR